MTFRDYTFGYCILGEGFSSTVYKAKKNKSKRLYALKLINHDFLKTQFEKQLLLNEISVHEAVSHHKNFVTLIQHGKNEKGYVFVMEYCSKGSLSQFLQKNKRLTQTQAIYIIKQVIQAYKLLYSLKILHRDIKPANILFTQKNQVKLCDFGLSIKLTDYHQRKNLRVGTPCFMAPEVVKNEEFTAKSDIWSIGVTYFYMLTGQLPFKSQNPQNFIKQVNETKLQAILPKQLSEFSRNFLLSTLQIDPKKRMSVEELFYFEFENNQVKVVKTQTSLKRTQKNQNKSLGLGKQIKLRQFETSSHIYKATNKDLSKNYQNQQKTQQTQASQTNIKVTFGNRVSLIPPNTSKCPKFSRTPDNSTYDGEDKKSSERKKNLVKRSSISPFKNISPRKQKEKSKQQQKILIKQMQKITKILLNQIDFLRYTLKIIHLIDQYFERQYLTLQELMDHFICIKITDLQNFFFIDKEKIKSYKKYPIYNQWTSLVEDFSQIVNYSEKGKFRPDLLEKQLSKTILQIYLDFDKSLQTKQNAGKLATLDHLICYRDLFQMAKKGQEYFLKNSMLNLILQGIQNTTIRTDQIGIVFAGIKKKLIQSNYSFN